MSFLANPNRYLGRSQHFLQCRAGPLARIFKVATGYGSVDYEPHWTTDSKQLFVAQSEQLYPIQTLDMAVCHEGDVLTYENEIVYYI